MVAAIKPEEVNVEIKFGGGLHTRASEDQIDPLEAHDGANFLLDLENRELRNRPPFDLIATVPNAQSILGGGSLLKSDGTVSTLVQAGTVVYEWDGLTGFTQVGTVTSGTKLRGHWRTHNWTLDDKLILTDLSLLDVVKEWDGTTFASTVFTKKDASSFGTFYAKYLHVENERAVYSHVRDPSVTTPHMIVGSQRGDYSIISVADRPASSLSEEDPFFLLTPDLRPINGYVSAFGISAVSSEKGRLYRLDGTSAKDFAFSDLYAGSAASGAESVVYTGNDIIYGRQGRIESVRGTQNYGDIEADDLSRQVSTTIQGYTGWTNIYNSRLNRTYLFPSGVSELWVVNNSLIGSQLSPWMKWTTAHAMGFKPTFAMSMLDPITGLEFTALGDSSGNFYNLEGTGSSGDAGANPITTSWTSRLFSAKLDAKAYNCEGWISYHKNDAATVTITILYAGISAFDESITVTLPAISGAAVYGGAYYYGGSVYYGIPFNNRLVRQKFSVPGQDNEFQIKVEITGTSNFHINGIGLRFRQAS